MMQTAGTTRRRKCKLCERLFYTQEVVIEDAPEYPKSKKRAEPKPRPLKPQRVIASKVLNTGFDARELAMAIANFRRLSDD